jgi:ankyrin repeat protein
VSPPVDLIKAIRTGQLSEVLAALSAGATVELNDGQGEPGLPLAIACFMGHPEIVRELVMRGARVNFPDNRAPTSPLSMAIRGGKKDVIKVLIELGADIPQNMATGLTDQELMLSRWKAQHFEASSSAGPDENESPVVEEIQVLSCYGTDTGVLDAEMRRAVEEICKK